MTTAWPNLPPVEMIAFAYDGWSILRIGATPTLPLTYEATHPELPGDVLVAGSLGEARDLMDDTRAIWDAHAERAYIDAPPVGDASYWCEHHHMHLGARGLGFCAKCEG